MCPGVLQDIFTASRAAVEISSAEDVALTAGVLYPAGVGL